MLLIIGSAAVITWALVALIAVALYSVAYADRADIIRAVLLVS